VRALFHWLVPVDPVGLIESAWAIRDRFGLSFWDALVVGAAEGIGCGCVLSGDLQSGQDLAGVRVLSPLQERPEALPT
jgi:predicted nucleic acid-binding protein